MKNLTNTPLGIIIAVGLIVLGVEVIVMEVLFAFVAPLLQARGWTSGIALDLIDAVLLTIAVSPALYFLIFKKITKDAEKLSKITESARDAIIVMSTDGRVSLWNTSAERIFGYTATEAIGQDLHTLIAPKSAREVFTRNLPHFQKTGKGPILEGTREVTAKRKSGEEFPAELSVSALFTSGEWNAVGVVHDISARKKREDVLRIRDSELAETNRHLWHDKAKNEALLASLGEGMVATDNEGKIITMNRMAEKMLDLREADALGENMIELIPAVTENGDAIPAEKRLCLMSAIDKSAATQTGTMYFIKKDGNKIPVAVTATPVVVNGDKIGAIVIFRDITAEKELEETRRDLLSLASHQLRTPLSGTKWLIETVRKGIHGTLTKNQEEYLDEIYKINERMTSLVHDMLSVLRMEGDITPIQKEHVTLAALFGIIFETLQSAAKSKEITLRLVESGEYEIETDPLLLRNVLECLISNAVNYSPKGSEVVISIEKTPEEFIFAVKDSGIGIPLEEQRQIFQRFYRASNAKTYDTHGTGLGLYIASTLTKKLGGRLSFESEKDKGATFFVHLPHLQTRQPEKESI